MLYYNHVTCFRHVFPLRRFPSSLTRVHAAAIWDVLSCALEVGISWLGAIVRCGGANSSSMWSSLLLEGFFAAGCNFPRGTTRSERERELGGPLHAWRIKAIAIDGVGVPADGSTEGR